MDREVFRLRDTMSARFADIAYNGFWYSPEMEFILAAVEKSQEVRERRGVGGEKRPSLPSHHHNTVSHPNPRPPPPPHPFQRVSGTVDVQLFKGRASIIARSSPLSLYSAKLSSMDVAGGWNPQDSTGFIRINSVRLRAHTAREKAIKSGAIKA
jgi:argininosuccinate synthase